MAIAATEKILGINFWNESAEAAVEYISPRGGVVVAPSGTCFERFLEDADYRLAITSADIALVDSGLMASLWRLHQRRHVKRVSGLAFLQALLARLRSRDDESAFWVLPHERAGEKLLSWSRGSGVPVAPEDCYIAPIYGRHVHDKTLLKLLNQQRPRHIVIGIGAGAQERLGHNLRQHLDHRPAIHCTGGALGFITGDQVAIPQFIDRLYLGWFLRLLSQPRIFIPRLKQARLLPKLIARYGSELPPMKS